MSEVKLTGRIKLKVVDKNGKVLKTHEQKMNSFLRNFDHILALIFALAERLATPAVTLKDVDGYDRDIHGIAALSYHPIIRIGKGTAPVSPDDYKLADEISNFYVEGFDYDSANRTITVRGAWTNTLGYPVTVTEVGITWRITYYYENSSDTIYKYFLIIRDLLDTPVEVPDGASLTVEFTITVKASGS